MSVCVCVERERKRGGGGSECVYDMWCAGLIHRIHKLTCCVYTHNSLRPITPQNKPMSQTHHALCKYIIHGWIYSTLYMDIQTL